MHRIDVLPSGGRPALTSWLVSLLPWLIVIATFVADLLSAAAVIVWTPYLLAIVLSTLQGQRAMVGAVTVFACLLTLLGGLISPNGLFDVGLNRVLGIGVMMLCGVLCLYFDRLLGERQTAINRLQELNDTLERWISERTEALRQSEERLQLALEASGDGLWDWNLITGEMYFSPRWLQTLGYQAGELPPHINSWEQLIHPEDLPHVLEALKAHFDGKAPLYECENRLRMQSGVYRWNLSRGKVVSRDAANKPLRMIGLDADISSRKRAEERFRLAVEAAPSGMIMINPQGTIVLANAEAERIFGYRREELLGQSIELLVPPRFRDQHPQHRQSFFSPHPLPLSPEGRGEGVRSSRVGANRELFGIRADGTEFPVEIGLNPIVTEDGAFVLSAILDITERKLAEEKLRYYAAELQERNEQLLRSNQELDEFAYIASHDLKEPLRGIHNFSQFLIEDYHDKLDEAGQQKLHTLMKLSTRLEDLIDSLHQYSRLGRVDLALVPTDLHKLVEDVIESLRITIDQEGVEIRMPQHLPSIICDHVRVGEVFRNLITNAMKYNDKEHKWIEIGVRPTTPVTFYVRDNGIGIRDKHQDAIFRIFKRLHGRDQFGGGTGVGLTIVKKIVERHGGRIWVESIVAQGTTFCFTLQEAP